MLRLFVIAIFLVGCSVAEPAPTATATYFPVYATRTAIARLMETRDAQGTRVPTRQPTRDLRSAIEHCVEDRGDVRYVIDGAGVSTVSLTWENDTGGVNQGDYQLPFCIRLDMSSGDFVYISAQIISPTSGAGSIRCTIYSSSNARIARAEASGFASIATCSGSVP